MIIKILNLNLFEGGLFFDNILDFIEKEKPDILSLQEVFDSKNENLAKNYCSVNVLSENLPEYYHFFDPEFIALENNEKLPLGNAIFSKFPIASKNFYSLNPYLPFGEYDIVAKNNDYSNHPKNIQHAEIFIDVAEKKSLNIFNLHGIWGLDGTDNPARLKMSEIIIEAIKNKDNVILSGDFNLQPNTKTILNIEKHLTNIFRPEIDSKKLISTFNMKHKTNPGYATAIVDMFFTSKNMRIRSKKILLDDLSDHLGILVEIDL